MDPMMHNNDEDKRLKRDEDKPTFTTATFLQWWLIPGSIGIISILIGKFIIDIIISFSAREPFGRGVNKVANNMVEQFNYLSNFDFASTNIWTYMLFGMVLGILIKYAYSDEAI